MASKRRMQTISEHAVSPFGTVLDGHLVRGTRPDGTPSSRGVPWTNKEFAKAVGAKGTEGEKNERTIRNWRNGSTIPSPADLHAILQTLFGGKVEYAECRTQLNEKYQQARGDNRDKPDDPPQSSVHTSIPTKPLRCLGRDEDLKSVIDALIATRDQTAVLVLGGPGMGKTTLTRQAVNNAAVIARFGQRRWFVELETATNAEALEKAIVIALGLDAATAKFQDALARLGQTTGLLILDNLETPWDAEREKVESVLAALHRVAGLALLGSIRGGEAPAGLRWTRRKTVEPLEAPHDRALFLDIAQDIAPDDPDLVPLLADLGGIPLAVELVAMQAQSAHSLKPTRDEWRRVGTALAQRPRAPGSRLTSLDISLELSVASPRLSDAGQRLFSILGKLPAGICDEDLNALLGNDAFEARQGLLSSGLGYERASRLDLLPPVREHARRQHLLSEDESELWGKHFLSMAHALGPSMFGHEGGTGVRRIAAELPNLDAALHDAIANQNLNAAAAALSAIVNAMERTGLGTTAMLWDLATACRVANDTKGEALALDAIGYIALARSDHVAARKAYEQALPLYQKVGATQDEADCIKGLGDIALARSDHDAARKVYQQALPLYQKVGSIVGEANCILSLGDIALRRSDHDAARKAYEQALPLFQKVGAISGEANCISSLGDIALARSDHDTARKAYEQALSLYQKVGSILGEANCILSLGNIAFERSEHDAARKAYEQALPLYQKIGDIQGEANCIRSLGDIALARSDHDAARKAYEQALPLFQKVGAIQGEANCIKRLGDIALTRSDHDAARKAYEQVRPLYQKVGDIRGEANCIQSIGDIALARSDHDAARKAYEQALEFYMQIAEPFSIGHAHLRLAQISKGKARAQHLAAARAAWHSIDRPDLIATLED